MRPSPAANSTRLRRLLEGGEALGGIQMPDGCRRPPVAARRHRQIHVAHGPARIGTDTVHGILQGLRTTGAPRWRPGDVLDQLQEGGALRDALFERGVEGGQALLMLAELQILLVQRAPMLLQGLVQAEFLNGIGNRPVQRAAERSPFTR